MCLAPRGTQWDAPRARVDDAARALPRLNVRHHVGDQPVSHDALLQLHRGSRQRVLEAHAVLQVGPVERELQHLGRAHAEARDDVCAHIGGARGGEGDDGNVAQRTVGAAEGAELEVGGAEVVAPLAGAVRFIHR